eukprot:TRINITY_DN3469_c0_g1_i1.p1 TRINITY_DN3469_c0_g1~~TRINITY_DN3469_c0_g1_i1.p1  ORF type:complete len:528 (+),score=125.99 TRINITY_DN3469_c0_g1_i1:74-1657(+)
MAQGTPNFSGSPQRWSGFAGDRRLRRRPLVDQEPVRTAPRGLRRAEAPSATEVRRRSGRKPVTGVPQPTADALHHNAQHTPESSLDVYGYSTVSPRVKHTSAARVTVRRAESESIGLCVDEDLRVTAVVKGGAADKAGLKKGQRLTGVNGQSVRTQEEAIVAMQSAGTELTVAMNAANNSPRRAIRRGAGSAVPRSVSPQPCTVPHPPPEPVGLRHLGPPGCGPLEHDPSHHSPRPAVVDSAFQPSFAPADQTCVSPSRRRVAPRWNKTSYELAMDKGEVEGSNRRWASSQRTRGMRHYEPQTGVGPTHHHIPEVGARTETFLAHSPRRGRDRSSTPAGARRPAAGAVPDAEPSVDRAGRRLSSSARRDFKHDLLHHDHTVTDNTQLSPRRSRVRSYTPQPGRPGQQQRVPWYESHGDIIGNRYRNDPHVHPDPPQCSKGVPLSPRRRRRPSTAVAPWEAPTMKRRSFTPTARHQKPMPATTDIFHVSDPITGACLDTVQMGRSGKRTTDALGVSPRGRSTVGDCIA